jgi:hypothetical protein
LVNLALATLLFRGAKDMHYRVTQNRGCQSPSGIIYAPGQKIDSGEFDQGLLDRLVTKGFLETYDPNEAPPPPPVGRVGRINPSIWAMDPSGIRGLDVDQLNIMILERDDRIEPFETAEEAAAWLCQDFEEIPV